MKNTMKHLSPRIIILFFFSYLAAWIVIGGIAALVGTFLFKIGGEKDFWEWIFTSVFLLFLITGFFAWLRYHFYRYELTKDGYKSEQGILRKRYVSIPYNRIQNVDIYRSIPLRILGLSDLQIHTSGYSNPKSSNFESEGRLPGLLHADAEKLRDDLVRKTKKTN